MHRCDCWSGKTAVVALEISSCHSRKLCDKAEACDHFLSIYFWDFRQNVLYSIFTPFSLIHLPAAIFNSSLSEAAECTIAISSHKRRARRNEIKGDNSIHTYWYDICLDFFLNRFELASVPLRLEFNIYTGSSSIWAGLGQKNSEWSWTSPWLRICSETSLAVAAEGQAQQQLTTDSQQIKGEGDRESCFIIRRIHLFDMVDRTTEEATTAAMTHTSWYQDVSVWVRSKCSCLE